MSIPKSFSCILKGRGQELAVLRFLVHHEVACLPEALVLIHADAIKLGDGQIGRAHV